MQQRRVRLGDILDDYCPRERRITNHAVVAMVDDEVKQTRCTTCDADHAYKHAKVPPQRRKRAVAAIGGPPAAVEPLKAAAAVSSDEMPGVEPSTEDVFEPPPPVAAEPEAPPMAPAVDEEGPVHRRLIRATLPRPNGQPPERREPEFTIRQPGVRGRPFDQKSGSRHGRRAMRAQGGQPQRFGQPPRHGSGHGPGHGGPGHRPSGDRPGQPGGPRHRHAGGRGGRKRGR
ncbi:MAG: hypothetical protein HYY76_09115 [Acidobacteria bacterium]|nr:hypothetical protein [Acidobacteriota bacterium]